MFNIIEIRPDEQDLQDYLFHSETCSLETESCGYISHPCKGGVPEA